MPEPSDTQIVAAESPESLSPMIPGQYEPRGSLTRFAVTPDVVHTMVDRTIDAAGVADRQREGGGAPSERRPARVSRWAALMERLGVMRVRETRPAVSVSAPVALNPPVL
jgi:hypothetical protein